MITQPVGLVDCYLFWPILFILSILTFRPLDPVRDDVRESIFIRDAMHCG